MEKELPKGWVETELGSILKLKNGYAFKSGDYAEQGTPLIRISDIQDGFVTTKKSVFVESKNIPSDFIVKKGDVLVAMSGATTGKFGVYEEDKIAYQNQRVGNLTPHSELYTSRKFIYYLLAGLRNEIEERAYGGAQPNISSTLIEGIPLILPPKPEQERIVAKLDALFGELEKVKTSLSNIPTLLKNFRQTVLTQAVTGKLTQEWRLPAGKAGVGKELGEWQETKLDDLILFAGNGLSKRRGTEGEEITVLRLADFKKSVRTYGEERSVVLNKKEQEKYVLDIDDLLIVRVNGSVDLAGKFILYSERDKQEAYCDHFIRVKVDPQKIGSLYLTYITNSGEGRQYLQNSLSTSAGQNTINQKSVRGLTVNLPSLEEQQEIVRRVEALFAQADAIEGRYATLKQKIEQLPQAILAKAFRGELVPQLPTDGDAKELLEEIKKLKVGGKK